MNKYGLDVRFVIEEDAQFIVELRTDPIHGRFIGRTDSDVREQEKWIQAYKQRETEGTDYYFMFSLNGKRMGVYRIYDIEGDSFVSGSWVFHPESPKGAGILGCLIGREIAYEQLGLERNFVDVYKANKSSLQFQLSFHPTFIREEEDGRVYYEHSKDNFYKIKDRYVGMCVKLLK